MNWLCLIVALRKKLELDSWRTMHRGFQMPPMEFYALLEAGMRERRIPGLQIKHHEYNEAGLLSDRRVYLRFERGQFRFDCFAFPFGTSYLFSYWHFLLPRPFTLSHLLGLAITLGLLPAMARVSMGMMVAMMIFCAVIFWATLLGQFGFMRRLVRKEDKKGGFSLPDVLHGISIIGVIFELFFRLPTYFERDTACAFLTVIHEEYLEILDGLQNTHGLRALSQSERRKPIMRGFYK